MAPTEQASTDRLRAQRAALADFGLHAFRADDLDELLHGAAELVSQALDIPLVKVLEHRPERGELLIRSGVNWQPGVVGHVTMGDDLRSPGGYALKTGVPVVSRDVDTEARFAIPEVLVRHGVKSMVNVLILGEKAPFGVLEVDAPSHRDFTDDDIAYIQIYANFLAAAIDRIRSHQELRRRAREQGILARELGHRVKNVLSLVQALASQTSTKDRSGEEFKRAFTGRLQALAAAETLVFDAGGDVVDPLRIAEVVLEPHRTDRPAAVIIDGPSAELPARKGRMLGLAIHELATNAAKYGALSEPSGLVRLEWRLEERDDAMHLRLHWQEKNGPEIAPPERKGFGTRLLTDVVSHELNGTSELSYHRTGWEYQLVFPVD